MKPELLPGLPFQSAGSCPENRGQKPSYDCNHED